MDWALNNLQRLIYHKPKQSFNIDPSDKECIYWSQITEIANTLKFVPGYIQYSQETTEEESVFFNKKEKRL